MSEKQDKDLSDLLPESSFNHPDCFGRNYSLWETQIAAPILEADGFEVGHWYSIEEDSFGPLVRGVSLTKEGITEDYFYG